MNKTLLLLVGAVCVVGAAAYLMHSDKKTTQLPPVAALNATTSIASTSAPLPMHTVGQVSRHAGSFMNTEVLMKGYVLVSEKGYSIVSDEPTGAISRYDLPVTGAGIETMRQGQLYSIQGILRQNGLVASNGNPDHLELTKTPEAL